MTSDDQQVLNQEHVSHLALIASYCLRVMVTSILTYDDDRWIMDGAMDGWTLGVYYWRLMAIDGESELVLPPECTSGGCSDDL